MLVGYKLSSATTKKTWSSFREGLPSAIDLPFFLFSPWPSSCLDATSTYVRWARSPTWRHQGARYGYPTVQLTTDFVPQVPLVIMFIIGNLAEHSTRVWTLNFLMLTEKQLWASDSAKQEFRTSLRYRRRRLARSCTSCGLTYMTGAAEDKERSANAGSRRLM